ncbi:hypothetical protein EI555_009802, partial [Monodon monoceros]
MAHWIKKIVLHPGLFLLQYKRSLDLFEPYSSVAADRIAIQSKGRYTANLSPQNLISCCGKNHYGCNSGSIDRAWWYLRKRGLVSHACYPLFKDQNATNNGCAMTSRSDRRGKRHATKPCPNSIEKSNRIYQCSPPYRVSS